MLVAIILAIVSTDSIVHPAMCGVSIKLRSFNNLSLGSGGSSQNTTLETSAPDCRSQKPEESYAYKNHHESTS